MRARGDLSSAWLPWAQVSKASDVLLGRGLVIMGLAQLERKFSAIDLVFGPDNIIV